MRSTSTLMGISLYNRGVKRMDRDGSGLVLPKLMSIRIKGFPRITNIPCTACVFVCVFDSVGIEKISIVACWLSPVFPLEGIFLPLKTIVVGQLRLFLFWHRYWFSQE